ncbi:MAG TPA: hypothetical protein VK772_09605 [Puia sp.]|jgi:putative ABC transport system permease protein|nr:hypothetical protein [Puia sp.]
MIKNYFRTALGGFLRNKLFTLINISGLSIGISASLAIYCIIQFDFNFDNFYPESNRIYRVVSNLGSATGGVRGPLPEAARVMVSGLDASAPFLLLTNLRSITLLFHHLRGNLPWC